MLDQPFATGLDDAISRAIAFLHARQHPNGSFAVYCSPDPELVEKCTYDRTPYAAAVIAYSAGFSDDPAAREIVERTIPFFLGEMSPEGLWNYETRDDPWHPNVPPDVDDTSLVSLVLERHRIAFPENRRILLASRNRAGLFYTWIIPRLRAGAPAAYWRVILRQLLRPLPALLYWKIGGPKPSDVDAGINANVLLYLGDVPEARPVVAYLKDVLRSGSEARSDKWYRPFMFYYALARIVEAGIDGLEEICTPLVERIGAVLRPDAPPIDVALAACALAACDASPALLEALVQSLVRTQRESGCWTATPLYWDGPARAAGFGSEELTTGFALEALLRYRQSGERRNVGSAG